MPEKKQEKHFNDMTRKEFEAVPRRAKWDEETRCFGLVILPSRKMHDSGYRCMDFVAIDEDNKPICRLSGCSDVIHVDGIGGYGYRWSEKNKGVPKVIPPSGWSIDCLPKSGLLHRKFGEETVCFS